MIPVVYCCTAGVFRNAHGLTSHHDTKLQRLQLSVCIRQDTRASGTGRRFLIAVLCTVSDSQGGSGAGIAEGRAGALGVATATPAAR